MATSDEACQRSAGCREGDDCYLHYGEGACYDGYERASKGMMITGIVFSGVGAMATLVGVLGARCRGGGDYNLCPFGKERETVGTGIAVAGGALALIGATLAISGGIKTQKRRFYVRLPAITVGPTGGVLTWAF